MISKVDPTAKARWVLETKGITGIPAESLHNIAESENIRYSFCELPDEPDLSGELLFRGDKKGIIINTLINHKGRHNFTFAHELGHYFLGHQPSYVLDNNTGFWCSINDIGESLRPQEIEANRFAVELLMPEGQFRLDMAGAPIDFDLINSLSKKYMVSKHASSNRILDFVQSPYVIITTNGCKITSLKCSLSARTHVSQLSEIPNDTPAYDVITNKQQQTNFDVTDPIKWLSRGLAVGQLYECTRGNGEYYMTILRW